MLALWVSVSAVWGETKEIRLKNVTQSASYAVKCEVKPRQRAIIKAGGLLNYTRQAAKA